MLSLVLIVVIVANVVLWSYQMNQLDWEKMREDINIVDIRDTWSCNPSGYNLLGSTQYVSGQLSDLPSDNKVYMTFRSYASAYTFGTIGFDAASSTIQMTPASLISWGHTTGTGNNRLLLVAVGVHVATGTPTTVASVTYDGVSLTQATTALYSATDPQVRTYVFRLVNPSSGTKTVQVNFAAATLSVAGAVTYNGVNQTEPIQTSNTATGSGTVPSVSVTVTGSNKWVFGHLGGHRTASPTAWTITEGAGQTQRWAQTGELYKCVGSDKENVPEGSNSMSWALTRAASFVATTIVINPSLVPTEYTMEVEFSGTSNTYSWAQLDWTVDSAWTIDSVTVTLQLYNYTLNDYPTSGNGYIAYTSSDIPNTDETKNQTITIPTDFRNATGHWRMRVKGIKATNTQFDFKVDWVEFKAVIEGTLFTFKNDGPITSRLVSLWVINSTIHQRYDIDAIINSGETLPYLRVDVNLPSGQWMVKVVTERGNIATLSGE